MGELAIGIRSKPMERMRALGKRCLVCLRCQRGSTKRYGSRDIGLIGSICLLVNNICGPAMVQLPTLFYTAGGLTSAILFLVVALWTMVAVLFLAKTLAQQPFNSDFSHRLELSKLTQKHLPPRWAQGVILVLCFALTALNVSQIIILAQTVDSALLVTAGKTCGIVLHAPVDSQLPPYQPLVCITSNLSGDSNSPFGDSAYVISLGYVITAVLVLPFSVSNLDDNIWLQTVGMAMFCFCMAVIVAQFAALSWGDARNPWWAAPAASPPAAAVNYVNAIETVLANYFFVMTVPSWLAEKRPGVGVASTVGVAVVASTVLYLLLGLVASASPIAWDTTDVVSTLVYSSLSGVWIISKVAAFIFPMTTLLTSIPVFSIITRYNLVNAHVMPGWAASCVSWVIPWGLTLAFYAGSQLGEIITWTSALVVVELNLLLPPLLYLAQARERRALGDRLPLPLTASSRAIAGNPPSSKEGFWARSFRPRKRLRGSSSHASANQRSSRALLGGSGSRGEGGSRGSTPPAGGSGALTTGGAHRGATAGRRPSAAAAGAASVASAGVDAPVLGSGVGYVVPAESGSSPRAASCSPLRRTVPNQATLRPPPIFAVLDTGEEEEGHRGEGKMPTDGTGTASPGAIAPDSVVGADPSASRGELQASYRGPNASYRGPPVPALPPRPCLAPTSRSTRHRSASVGTPSPFVAPVDAARAAEAVGSAGTTPLPLLAGTTTTPVAVGVRGPRWPPPSRRRDSDSAAWGGTWRRSQSGVAGGGFPGAPPAVASGLSAVPAAAGCETDNEPPSDAASAAPSADALVQSPRPLRRKIGGEAAVGVGAVDSSSAPDSAGQDDAPEPEATDELGLPMWMSKLLFTEAVAAWMTGGAAILCVVALVLQVAAALL